MKYNRVQLMKAIENKINEVTADWEQARADNQRILEQNLKAWQEGPVPAAMREVGSYLATQARLRKPLSMDKIGEIIDSHGVAEHGYYREHLERLRVPGVDSQLSLLGKKDKPPVERLEKLLDFLGLTDDDVVTSSGLTQAGFDKIGMMLS